VAINPVIYAEIYAEISPDFDDPAALEQAGIEYREIPREGLFLAGRAHQAYRRRGGERPGVLPDFFIDAHAAVLGVPMLTRDTRRFKSYFPGVRLSTPSGTS
jgi:predicted nucleic acid-binding protein